MEEVLGSTSKVLVDVKGGNNMMYLPLDKIIQQSSANATPVKQRNDVDNLRQQLGTSQNSQLNSSSDRYSNDRYNSGRYN
jgi:membrane protease subunit HflK